MSRPKKTPTTMVPLISTIAGDNSRSSLVSTIAGILSTVTTSSSATNPSSSAGATAMAVTQTVKKPSKPVKKNHACEMCGKAFRDVYHLNRHKLSHSDEKPFECPICNQRFKRKDRMTYHVRSHEGGITKPYTCGVCGKGFSRYHVENPRRAQVLAFHNQEGLSCCSEGWERGEGIKSRAQLRGTGGQRAVDVLKWFPHLGYVGAAGARRATLSRRAQQAVTLPLSKAVGLPVCHLDTRCCPFQVCKKK